MKCARFTSRNSSLHAQMCGICAAECEKHDSDHCKRCAASCRSCTDSCRQLATAMARK